MNCCVECFNSDYIREIINKNSNQNGKCDFCDCINVALYNPVELSPQFKNLLDLYIPVREQHLIDNYSPLPLVEQLNRDFPEKIFKITNNDKLKRLLISIVKEDINDYQILFENLVILECSIKPDAIRSAESLKLSWEEFVYEIKFQNRYHINHVLDLNKLKILFKRHLKEYPKGKILFRSRLSDKNGFSINDMGCPPINKTKAGRANPDGIPYLYLSNDLDTTIYETRAYLYDYITIGEFMLKENLSILNLRETKIYDPMVLADTEDLEDFLIHLPFIEHLEQELSKPVRRNDNELDYIPTQYLSEFTKSLNYDGIEYKSSLNPIGYNLAIFNPLKIECIKVYVKEVSEIKYIHTDVNLFE